MPQSITLEGKAYVVIPRDEYEALERLARMPPLPEKNASGNYPAAEFARASIARDIIKDRVRLGLSQAQLARLAGIRPETLCRIESGKVTPTVASIDKIDRALRAAGAGTAKARRR